jgi:hypothetical protein
MAHAVDGGGIDPIDAKLERAMNRGNGIGVVLLAPAEFPAGPAGSASKEAEEMLPGQFFRRAESAWHRSLKRRSNELFLLS